MMHHFESMPSLHLTSNNDSFPTSPPASPLSFTSTPSIAGKPSRGHTHRRSLAISSHLTLPAPIPLDQNPALITPPLSSPAWSFPKTASFESLRSDDTMLDYDSDPPRTPIIDDDFIHTIPSLDLLLPRTEGNGDIILPDTEPHVQAEACESLAEVEFPAKLRKVAFNDAIIYYPPRPQSSRQPSFSSQISQSSSRETTPSIPSPRLSRRRSLSSFLLPSPTFLPSSAQRHAREPKSWAGLIASPFTAARRRRSPNQYRPPTPPLGHDPSDHDNDMFDPWQPLTPIIDLDAALGPFQTPASPLSTTHSAKLWSMTSHVGTHRRSESAPEIRGLAFDTPVSPSNNQISESILLSQRGMKRKMSVIDEEERQLAPDEMEIDNELHQIMLEEGAEMGEMGDLVVDSASLGDKFTKRRSWRQSLKEWWRKV